MACGVLSGKYQSYPYEGRDLALKEAKRERKLQCSSARCALEAKRERKLQCSSGRCAFEAKPERKLQ
jgi:hypothetical protein